MKGGRADWDRSNRDRRKESSGWRHCLAWLRLLVVGMLEMLLRGM